MKPNSPVVTGSILELTLPNKFGFAYCKICDFRYIREFDGVLVKVFDFISPKPVNDICVLSDKDWLFGARRMIGLPGTRGKEAWKHKGILSSQDDFLIPDFKYSHKSFDIVDDLHSIYPWYIIRDLVKGDDQTFYYDQVSHLEDTIISGRNGIALRTAMEFSRANGIEIGSWANLVETLPKTIYRQMINIPIYRTIPKQIRGRGPSNII